MTGLVTAITTGVAAFGATNIDDIAILLLFFSQVDSTLRYWHIVIGQYLGFTAIVLASLPGFLGSSLLSPAWIGLLGFIPITIGLNRILNQEDMVAEVEADISRSQHSITASFLSPQTYSIAVVTFANGGDNIGIYVPLFASSNWNTLIVILSVFFLLVGVWCYVAYLLTEKLAIALSFTRYVNYLVPFVLIGLGSFIILSNQALSLFQLVASCLCLVVLVRKGDRLSEERASQISTKV